MIVSLDDLSVNRLHKMYFQTKVINLISNKISMFDAKIRKVQKNNNEVPSSEKWKLPICVPL